MTIKHLYPTSRPSLDLQFARDKKLDPRITYSRSSSGTYVDAGGVIQSATTNVARFDHNPTTGESLGLLVEEARTNLWTVSANPGFAGVNGTVVPNAAVAPDGTITAAVFTPNAASDSTSRYLIIPRANTLDTQQTVTFFIKTTYSYLVFCSNGQDVQSNVTVNVGINLTTNSVYQTTTSNGTYTSASVSDALNGYKRIAITYSSGGTLGGKQPGIIVSDTQFAILSNPGRAGDQTANYTTNGIKSLTIWGVQLETASFPTSYIPTPATFTGRTSTATYYDSAGVIQTALSGVARSNAFFPDSNGVMRSAGLLLEAAGTNLVTYSEQFDQWTSSYVSVTANSVSAPDGATTADTVTADGSLNAHWIFGVDPTAGPKTFSVFAKAGTNNFIQLLFAGDSVPYANFNLSTGAVGTIGSNSSASIQKLANGWYRCSLSTTSTTATTPYIGIISSATSARAEANTLATSVYLWGAQVEASPYPTSYIPTVASTVTRSADTSTSATVTRSADVAQITGTNFSSWYNQSAGTFFANYQKINTEDNITWLDVTDGTTLNRARILSKAGNAHRALVSTAGSSTFDSGVTSASTKVALSLGFNNSIFSVGGLLGTLDTAINLPVVNNLSFYSSGYISRLTYYPTRLPDATLQALTV